MRRLLLAAVALCTALPAQMTGLPTLSAPREVRTELADGRWHKWDNFGDGTLGTVVDGDSIRWVLMQRSATNPAPPAGCFWTKPYAGDPDPLANWAGNQLDPVGSAQGQRPFSHHNVDTWHWFQHPDNAVVHWLGGIKPGPVQEWAQLQGNLHWKNAAGVVFSIQRWTSTVFAAEPGNYALAPKLWLQPHQDAPWEHPVYARGTNSYWGGLDEGSVLVDGYNFPQTVGVGFYIAKTREEPDWTRQRYRGRIGRYAFYLTGPNALEPVRLPPPGPESYVFDPVRDGAGGAYGDTEESSLWGTAYTIMQPHVSMNPYDGLYHLVALQTRPSARVGLRNRRTGIGHWWSPNQGLNWYPDTKNPLWTLDTLGWPHLSEADRLNSPGIYWNPWSRKGWLWFYGNPTGAQNRHGTRLWVCEFDIP